MFEIKKGNAWLMERSKIFLFFMMLLCVPMVWAGQGHTGKPQAPIVMSLTAQDAVESGAKVSFLLKIMSQVDANRVSYTINLPAGVDRLVGQVYWQGKLRANEMSTFPFTVQLAKSMDQPITANAIMQTLDGTQYGANAVFSFPPVMSQFKSQASNYQRVQRYGRFVIEHSLK